MTDRIGELESMLDQKAGQLTANILRGDTWQTVQTHIPSVEFLEDGVVEIPAEGIQRLAAGLRDGDRVRFRLPTTVVEVPPVIEEPMSFADGRVVLTPATRTLSVDGEPVTTTPIEYGILNILAANAGNVVLNSQIQRAVWGDTEGRNRATVVHVAKCRTKLGEHKDMIHTVRASHGQENGGYILIDSSTPEDQNPSSK